MELMRDALVVRGLDHRIRAWNPAAERLHGWTAAESLGCLADSLLGIDPPCATEAVAAVLSQGHWRGRMQQRRKDGSTLAVEAEWTLVRLADGTPGSILMAHADAVQRRALAERLRQVQALEAMGQLTGGITHDFNNLLTVIGGNAEMLIESLAHDAELKAMAELMLAATGSGAALTGRLLSLTRGGDAAPAEVDVSELLAGLGRILPRIMGGQVRLRVAKAVQPCRVLADAARLEAAIFNLCLNARDAMPGGGEITVEAANVEEGPDRYLCIAVSDTGSGMPPEVAARAFEPFFTTKGEGRGSGLGLSMVDDFVRDSGGRTAIESRVGAGTRIALHLPAAPAATIQLS